MTESKYKFDDSIYSNSFKENLRQLIGDNRETIKALANRLKCTETAINQYMYGKTFPKTENLIEIALFFDCSLDYLLGQSPVKTPNASIKAICDYTGLNEEAVAFLHFIKDRTIPDDHGTLDIINLVLKDAAAYIDKEDHLHATLFSLLNQYLLSGSVRRKLDSEYIPGPDDTPEQIERNLKREESRKKTVKLTGEASDDILTIVKISSLYKEYLIAQIRKSLDAYLEKDGDQK